MRPLLPLSRAVFVLGACLTAGTGPGLFAAADRTAEFWAWTIKAPLSAAFFGAGYIGAAISLASAALARRWERVRVVAVGAATLTSTALVATLLELGTFAFDETGTRAAVAWTWLVVYAVLPPLVLTAFAAQERVVARDDEREVPALWATRLALGGAGGILAAAGVALLADWRWLADGWPWPLPTLPARVVGAWLCTYGAAFLWFALRERAWRRVRIGIVPLLTVLALDVAAAGRFWDTFEDEAGRSIYVAVLIALLALVAAVVVVEERRLHRARATSRA